MSSNPATDASSFAQRRALVTGATSGLGFEAAAQLADLGFGSVVLSARTAEKAEVARRELTERTGRDVFDAVVVDVASVASSKRAAAELVARDVRFDAVLLNAGMVPNDLHLTDEGIEVCFGSSIVGHHLITTALSDADRLADGARVVIVGSEAANGDLPKALGMSIEPFAVEPVSNGEDFASALTAFARGADATSFDGNRQYATTKVVSSWWAAEMQRRLGGRADFFTVSPGANLGTEAARHTTGAFKVMLSLMSRFGHLVGMNQPVDVGARRYVDVLTEADDYRPGHTYTSRPKKMVGELVLRNEPHLIDEDRQRQAIETLDALIAEVDAAAVGS